MHQGARRGRQKEPGGGFPIDGWMERWQSGENPDGRLEEKREETWEPHNNLGHFGIWLTWRNAMRPHRSTGRVNRPKTSATQTASRLCSLLAKAKGAKDELRACRSSHRPLRKINCAALMGGRTVGFRFPFTRGCQTTHTRLIRQQLQWQQGDALEKAICSYRKCICAFEKTKKSNARFKIKSFH